MFQPISFNVIRQALVWHGFPVPKLRQMSFYDYSSEEITAEYFALWTKEQFFQVLHPGHPEYMIGDDRLFLAKVQECFCEDVGVHYAYSDLYRDGFACLFYVRVSREVLAAASILSGD